MRQFYTVLLLMLCLPFLAQSQSQYTVNNNASFLSSTTTQQCFELTPAQLYQTGSVWSNTQVNLSQNFEVISRIYFGSAEANADGIAFMLQREGTGYIGNPGAGIGYHRFDGIYPSDIAANVPGPVPSFIVEFDTYQNGNIGNQNIGDPEADHVGFMSNSNAYHTSTNALKAPEAFSANIEDDQWHDAKFTWNATTKTMTVQVTTTNVPLVIQTFTYTGDIVNTIFGGNPLVYFGFTASTGSFNPNVQQVCIITPPVGCGQLRTQTPGGWGAPPRGNNPASYMYSHFAAAFPSGLTIGKTPNYNVKITTPVAMTNFLPCAGQAKKLTANYVNVAGTTLKNTLAGHLAALTLSVRFDQLDPSFGAAPQQLGGMIVGSGAFSGWTVSNFLAEANNVLGGGTSIYTIQQALETASAINENYVDGTSNNGYLKCPVEVPRKAIPVQNTVEQVNVETTRIYPNPSRGQFALELNAIKGNAQVVVINANGTVVERRMITANGSYQSLKFDLGNKASGLYLVKIITDGGEQIQKIVIQK